MAYAFGELVGNYSSTLPVGGRYTFLAFWVTAGDDDLNQMFLQKARQLQADSLSLPDQDGSLVPNFYPAFNSGSDGSETATQDLCIGFYENVGPYWWYGFVVIKMLYQTSFGLRNYMYVHDNNSRDYGLLDGWQAFNFEVLVPSQNIYVHVAWNYGDDGVYITGNVLSNPPSGGYTPQDSVSSIGGQPP